MSRPLSSAESALSTSGTAAVRAALLLVMIASGFAGLGYEMVWTRMLSIALGHEIVAVLAVLAAFFCGLALGAWLLGARLRHSNRPARWYALLEVTIAIWTGCLLILIPLFNGAVAAVTGPAAGAAWQWTVAFSATLLLLLPATAAMGATLPAMERLFTLRFGERHSVSLLYAANTLGAVLGTLVTTWYLAPAFGFTATLSVLLLVNLLCAALAMLLDSKAGSAATPDGPSAPAHVAPIHPGRLRATLFATGFFGIGIEVVTVRLLSQLLEDTVYTFAGLLSVYLLGTAVGAALYYRLAPRLAAERWLPLLLALLAATALLSALSLPLAEPLYVAAYDLFGADSRAALLAELTVAALVFTLPTLCMGATFSHLAVAARDRLGVGTAVAINTLGSALAPLVCGVLLYPLFGGKLTLLMLALAYLLLLPGAPRRSLRYAAAPLGLAMIVLLTVGPLRFVTVKPGERVVHYDEGIMASLAVIEDDVGAVHLRVNNHFTMGGTASVVSDRRQAHIPLLLHPGPESALFLGLGTGSTFFAVEAHPELHATAVELIPETLGVLEYFGPSAEELAADSRYELVTADARRYVKATGERFDVIIAEVFHPARDGAGSLYTQEHFRAVKARLNENGLFCQWLPLFQLDLETLRIILRTFLSVFPDAEAHLAHFSLRTPLIGLVGRMSSHRYGPGWLRHRVNSEALVEDLQRVRLDSDFALLGGYLGRGDLLASYAGAGPVNTDDHPVVMFRAPEFAYANREPSWKRVLTLANSLRPDAEGLLFHPQAAFGQRLQAYWRARNAYLAAGVNIQPSDDIYAMLAQTRQPLLDVVRISSDFQPAYRPLLGMATALSARDAELARALLLDLQDAGPGRPEAARLLRQLSAP